MLTVIKRWGDRYFSEPEAVLLFVLLLGSLLLLMTMGHILTPIIASIVIAYLLNWVADVLVSLKTPRFLAVVLVYSAFLGLFLAAIFILWPIIWQQLLRFYSELPFMSTRLHQFLQQLPEQFPQFLTSETVEGWLASFIIQLKLSGRLIFTASLATLPSVLTTVVYLVLIPMMVFFFLKDSHQIVNWGTRFLPKNKQVLSKVWKNVDMQIGNYVRGKVAEAFVIGAMTFVAFYYLKMSYTMLLSVLVGLSVLIPYIGAIVVTIPVILVGLFQWGWGGDFFYALTAYTVIQTFDGVVLVPLLFSKAVSLHPLAIIIAILVFGSWWGFWGAFFAIPLATLVNAVIKSWPTKDAVAR